ncbi:hypothetical protein M409DRAFT_51429 [Zasmidium cellare ATCC 36951]|uniref:Yeast cell wall synthesis Kre9/Knh1-like N-terminal domain-containing protein n=1 Tax=Zasmidium cellare ATCC 36951 TaxID=1080233 RepID=A0A6A6CW06_ZASCE|nr:uncharacterized protein M409DRAFT_51429 [Zasmidium cellare ATCC 36951]KAF2170380.1 hypothetical protein M409DRAFT_51429 [Zasmidium cellare ATCC 36951]
MPAFMQCNPLVHLLFLLSVPIHHAFAIGIEFTTPAGGATWPAGPITINWTDAGGDPNMADLTTYTLQLMVGGNSPDNSKALQTVGKENAMVSDKGVEDDIQADLAQSIQNGFYLMMTSNTSQGNQVINYSNRFTLIQMNGTTEEAYLSGANKEAGAVSNVPEAQYNVISQPTASATSSSTPSATSSSTASTVTSTASASPSATDHPHSGKSNGETAAIITGCIFAVIGLVSIFIWAVFFIRRARRKRAERSAIEREAALNDSTSDLGKLAFVDGKAELPAHSASSSSSTFPRELTPTTERYEMHGFDKRAEAPSEMVFELEGDIGLYEAGSGRKSKAYDPTL